MIGALRKKIVALIMAMVALVIVVMLSWSWWRTYTTQWGLVDESLMRGLSERGFVPVIGAMEPQGEFGGMWPQDGGGGARRMVAHVTVDSTGEILGVGDAALVDEDVLDDVVAAVLEGNQSSGRIEGEHVAWASEPTADGGLSVAIADTSDVEELLRTQALSSVVAFAGALLALFALTWPLSAYITQPVARAWDQQRRFVADASHELKTPLAVIVSNLGILSGDPELPCDLRRWVDGSSQAADQMQGLVGELLELARTDETLAGDVGAMVHEEVDLSDVVESAVLEFDAVAFEKGCEIASSIDEVIRLTGDADWLGRLVRILVDNAVKYARERSVVEVRLARGAGRGQGQRATFSVTNQGEPIPAEQLPHVFDRFWRSDAARSRSTGGFGLGLAIAKGIAESHEGTIAVESDAERGTTFTVRL
jgi:signal transduction histidine kinase